MHRSVVPYPKVTALRSLNEFLSLNDIRPLEQSSKTEIFRAYNDLVDRNKPRFVEKSPHHLFNTTNMDLIREYIEASKNQSDFKVIGLVRHPLSVVYSGWQRWKFDCAQFEREWTISYANLLQYKDVLNISIIRYEDLVTKEGPALEQVLGMEPEKKEFVFKDTSLHKWKNDHIFAHKLQPETVALAKKFGYDDFETPGNDLLWYMLSGGHRITSMLRKTARKVKQKLLPKRIVENQ
jgi:hypothetical protein